MMKVQHVAWVMFAAAFACGNDTSNAFDQDSASSGSTSTTGASTTTSTATTAGTGADETTTTAPMTTADGSTGDPIFDVGGNDTDISDGCGCEYEYIWIG